ncbi:MAG: hypothetical protein CK425_07985 [Parachlamydia sp.]|nr:MAG: hypothetical protein CK425_07985 [Parachlamydia sp.]
MVRTSIQSAQRIIPEGEVKITQQSGKWIAIQNGYIGGRRVKIEVEIGKEKISTRKTKSLMKEAVKNASYIAQGFDINDDKTSSFDLSSNGKITQHFKTSALSIVHEKFKDWLGKDAPKALGKNRSEIHLVLGEEIPLNPLEKVEENPKLPSFWKKTLTKILSFLNAKPIRLHRNAHLGLSAEHLSKGSLSQIPVEIVQSLLESEVLSVKLRSNAPSNFFAEHKKLSTAWDFEPSKINQKIKQMAVGECALFYMHVPGHSINGMAVKQPDGRLTYYQSNTGAGIRNHHSKLNKRGEKIFQQVYVIENIPVSQFRHFLSQYKTEIAKAPRDIKKNINWLYTTLKTMGPSKLVDDPCYWNPDQVSGSCAGGAEKAMVRAVLTKESFHTLKVQLETHSVFKMYKDLLSGKDTSYVNKVGILEIVKKLQSRELNVEMKIALETIQKYTESRIDKRKELKLSSKLRKTIFKEYAQVDLSSRDPVDLFKKIGFHIASRHYAEAEKLMIEFALLPRPEHPNPEEEKVIVNLISLYKSDKFRTRELIRLYFMLGWAANRRLLLDSPDPARKLDPALSDWISSIAHDYLSGKIRKYYPPTA